MGNGNLNSACLGVHAWEFVICIIAGLGTLQGVPEDAAAAVTESARCQVCVYSTKSTIMVIIYFHKRQQWQNLQCTDLSLSFILQSVLQMRGLLTNPSPSLVYSSQNNSFFFSSKGSEEPSTGESLGKSQEKRHFSLQGVVHPSAQHFPRFR